MPRSAIHLVSLLVLSGALAIGAAASAQASVTADSFSLTIDGVEIAQFSELAGISSSVEDTPATVTLRRGKNKDMSVFAWHQSVVEGQLMSARRNATLTMYDRDGTAAARYYLESAWPSKVEISGLKAGASEVLYETVTLTAEDIQRIAP
jgi:T4-like virus tail tube protein gp19